MDRTAEEIEQGIADAKAALAEGDVAVAAYLLDVPAEDIPARREDDDRRYRP